MSTQKSNKQLNKSESKHGIKAITQSQESLEKVGLATTTSFSPSAKFRSIKFQRGANGVHTNIIDI